MVKFTADNNLINMDQPSPLDTPPGSPITQTVVQNHPLDIINLTELFKEMIVSIKATSDSTSASTFNTAPTQPEQPKGRASRLEAQTSAVNELDEYIFVVRERIGQ